MPGEDHFPHGLLVLNDPPVEVDEIARVRTHNGRHLVVHRARLGGGTPVATAIQAATASGFGLAIQY